MIEVIKVSHPDKPTEVFLGKLTNVFRLNELRKNLPLKEKFNEIFFKTESGNIYRIYKSRNGPYWVLTDKKTKEKYRLTTGEMQYAYLETGEYFWYGRTNTGIIKEIVCVNLLKKEDISEKIPVSKIIESFFGKVAY